MKGLMQLAVNYFIFIIFKSYWNIPSWVGASPTGLGQHSTQRPITAVWQHSSSSCIARQPCLSSSSAVHSFSHAFSWSPTSIQTSPEWNQCSIRVMVCSGRAQVILWLDMEIEDQSEPWYLITNVNSPWAVWIRALAGLSLDLGQRKKKCVWE